MAPTAEPIMRPHLTVNTNEDIEWALDKLAHEIAATSGSTGPHHPSETRHSLKQGVQFDSAQPMEETR